MKLKNYIYLLLLTLFLGTSCSDYLDIVPDDVATIDNAFTDRTNAEKFLFTCYNSLPSVTSPSGTAGLCSGDEVWFYPKGTGFISGRLGGTNAWDIGRGLQNSNSPLLNYWDGANNGKNLWIGIRDCNIFLANIHKPQDLEDYERERWEGEVMFLKAYFHYYLLRLYGPIPIVDENLPVSADEAQVRVYREPVDEVAAYIVDLIDKAVLKLPEKIERASSEAGRITKPIALAVKAKLLTLVASPLFNGNPDYSGFTDSRGKDLFAQQYDENKWTVAAQAVKEAIDAAEAAGHKLYYYQTMLQGMSDSTKVKMNIRQSVCEKWNEEMVWPSAENPGKIQELAQAELSSTNNHYSARSLWAPTLRIAEQFYSNNGVPINEDNLWNYAQRYKTRKATANDRYYIEEGYVTANLHFDREPRFYATLGFDGAIWYGNGKLNDKDSYHLEAKRSQYTGYSNVEDFSITGYYAKKLVSYENDLNKNGFTKEGYSFPVIRMADLYLLYAEALNESAGPSEEVYTYLDKVRERAGLKGVKESWTKYSIYPNKPNEKKGLREIIQAERLNELALEGHRFYDLRRWRLADKWMNQPIKGWSVKEKETADYYQLVTVYKREFTFKDYLWPLKVNTTMVNPNLVQSPGW
ncbi:RagB/SusD family nutrient uptake outer membrane protein [Prolixibacteraceae bacterium JC049]|nr:RagB/SusD family nutrient uptake outer membrane protein [Prolixibacteraceae bacterium JC049]